MAAKCIPEELKLVVFDLDFTLWPYHVDSTVRLPFRMNNSTILDEDNQEIKPFPEAPVVLEYLREIKLPLAAASRTSKPTGAHQLLELFNWNRYFQFKEIYPGSKITHFEKFKTQSNVPYSSMLFFDDEERNIREVSQLGVKCAFVPPNGITMQLFEESIRQFKS